MNILITGISSGIGESLAKHYLAEGHTVYGCSRRTVDWDHENLHFAQIDLSQLNMLPSKVGQWVDASAEITFDRCVLNAAILGEVKDLAETSMEDLYGIMDTNVWANKLLLDCLLKSSTIKQVIAISSGASKSGHRGWSGYALSKASLNMLIQLYAGEFPDTHFVALAPGLVDTRMQDYLCAIEDETRYPSIKKLKAARGTETMPNPAAFVDRFEAACAKLSSYDSGSYVDVRQM